MQNNVTCLIYKKFSQWIPYPIYKKMRLEENGLSIVASSEYRIYYLNETATTFLSLVNGKRTIEEIIKIMHAEYKVEREVLVQDIIELLRDLQWKRIIILQKKNIPNKPFHPTRHTAGG